MHRDKYLDLYMGIYGTCDEWVILTRGETEFVWNHLSFKLEYPCDDRAFQMTKK